MLTLGIIVQYVIHQDDTGLHAGYGGCANHGQRRIAANSLTGKRRQFPIRARLALYPLDETGYLWPRSHIGQGQHIRLEVFDRHAEHPSDTEHSFFAVDAQDPFLAGYAGLTVLL
jgi:hypothetical protein